MRSRQKKLSGILLLLLVSLLAVGLISSGCVGVLQPVGWSGGAISNGTLFVGSEEGRLVAIDIATGSRQWSEPLRTTAPTGGFGCTPSIGAGGCATAPAGVAIYGTPAVSPELVYISGYNGKVQAYNSSSLSLRWVYPREGNLKAFVGGLLVAKDKVYSGCSDGKVYALDAATGDEVWEFQTGDKVWATPAIDGDTLFISSFDNNLYALNADDGSLKWKYETEGSLAATPLVYNNTVYVGSLDRYLYALDATSGSFKWKFMGENWFWAQPAVSNNIIYAPNLDGKVYALQAISGDKVAQFDTGSPVSSSPVVVNNSIIIASRQGLIYAIDTTSNALKLLTDIKTEVYGPLCASEGIVYIHAQDKTLHRVNVITGEIPTPISLKSGE